MADRLTKRCTQLLVILTVLMIEVDSFAQRSVSGRVTDAESGVGVDAVNVMLRRPDAVSIIAFAMTSTDGSYKITFNSEADTLLLMVSGFNVVRQEKILTKSMKTVDFKVLHSDQKIREVTVKADPVKRSSDTLTYYVSSFRDSTDRSIGDVLRKMPGIEVSESGGVKYNGVSINKFYIEGMDMLGGKYGIATNNVQAKDVASVEVYENHQPIKVLQDWVRSDQAALNLKLKEKSKGTWNGVVEAGAGYKPLQWSGQFTPMYFTKGFQTILTYKGNNMGRDVSKELIDQSGNFGSIPELVSIISLSQPPLDESTWLNNNIHSASANGIIKTGEHTEVTAQAHYFRDRRTAESSSETIFHLLDEPSFSISEQMSASQVIDELQTTLKFRHNSDRCFFDDNIELTVKGADADGDVVGDSETFSQHSHLPYLKLRNHLNAIQQLGKWQLNIWSDTDYARRKSYLSVGPNILEEYGVSGEGLRQDILSTKLYSVTSVSTSRQVRRWIFGLLVRGTVDLENFRSDLTPADSMRNDIGWRRVDLSLTPSIGYSISGRFSFDLYCPVVYSDISSNDRLSSKSDYGRVIISPNASLKWTPTYNLTIKASANYGERLGGLYDMFSGYILKNYRTLERRNGDWNRTRSGSVSLDLSYSNAVKAFFANASVMSWKSRADFKTGVNYSGLLSSRVSYHIPDERSGVSFGANASKRFQSIATTVKLGSEWSSSWTDLMRQGKTVPATNDALTLSAMVESRVSNVSVLSYSGSFQSNQFRMSGVDGSTPINSVRQTVSLNFLVGKKIITGASCRHFYNNGIRGFDRNMFFANLRLSFRHKRLEYVVEGSNLLGTKYYGTSYFGANETHSTLYRLRPTSVTASVRFSLK